MKRILLSIIVVLFSLAVSLAQAPKGINYQAVARDTEGNPLASKKISVLISILKNSEIGEVEYSERHAPTTNQFGLFTLVIGKGEIPSGNFAFISWAVGNKWLKIEIDPAGGSSYTLAGSQQLMTVPYAFYAEYTGSGGLTAGPGIAINSGVVSNTGDADNSVTNEIQILTNTPITDGNTLAISSGNSVTLKTTLDQVLTANPDAGGKRIQNLGAPINSADAATKSYVDTQNALDLDIDPTNELQNLSQVLTRGNDAGTQKITNLGAPTAANDAATKSYVDTQNALDLDQSATNEIQTLTYTPGTNNLAISGGNNVTINSTLTHVLNTNPNAGGIRIQNVGAPTAGTDATTKAYVDNAIATNYAFRTSYAFLNNLGSVFTNAPITLIEDFDDFNVIGSNSFTAPISGIYLFTATATSSSGGVPIRLKITSSGTTFFDIKRQQAFPLVSIVNYTDSMIYKLNAGDIVELVVTSSSLGDRVDGFFFGYKL